MKLILNMWSSYSVTFEIDNLVINVLQFLLLYYPPFDFQSAQNCLTVNGFLYTVVLDILVGGIELKMLVTF